MTKYAAARQRDVRSPRKFRAVKIPARCERNAATVAMRDLRHVVRADESI
jgi:hypothetical protein